MNPLVFFAFVFWLALGLILCAVVARDMERRGLDGRPYALLTIFLLPLGLLVWLYKRSTTPVVEDGH